MTYEATLAYLFKRFPSFKKYGGKAVKYSLKNIEALCALLDNPQEKFIFCRAFLWSLALKLAL